MLALTIRQPWAELIVCAKKTIEVRTWWPRLQLPVLVAIHAGKMPAPETLDTLPVRELAYRLCDYQFDQRLGGIIGVARFVERIEFCGYLGEIEGRARWERMADQHLNPLDWWTSDKIGFRFDQPVRFEQLIPCRGRQGFFELAEDVAAAVITAKGEGNGSTMQAHQP